MVSSLGSMGVYFVVFVSFFFFFFKQKTAYEILTCDWSSDVCSSDLWYHLQIVIRCTEHLQIVQLAYSSRNSFKVKLITVHVYLLETGNSGDG